MVYTSARAKPTPRFLLAVAALTFLSTLLFGCTNSHVTPSTQLTPASIDPHEKPASPAARAAIPVRCPSLNPSGAPVTLQSKGGHRVILSWRASAPSNLKHSAAIGYCIYRSIGPDNYSYYGFPSKAIHWFANNTPIVTTQTSHFTQQIETLGIGHVVEPVVEQVEKAVLDLKANSAAYYDAINRFRDQWNGEMEAFQSERFTALFAEKT